MKRLSLVIVLVVLAIGLLGQQWLLAQPGRRQGGPQGQRGRQSVPDETEEEEVEPEPLPPLPTDPQLLALERQFVENAEKLAQDYMRTHQLDKAVDVYREIVRLVPRYENGQKKLAELEAQQARAQQVTIEVHADQGWQETGVTAMAGKPISIQAEGRWTFTLQGELGPQGMEIPEELRDYNLGCLIAVIDTGNELEYEPFVVDTGVQFVAEHSGMLYLRMYDVDPSDNEGSLTVQIQGTFGQ